MDVSLSLSKGIHAVFGKIWINSGSLDYSNCNHYQFSPAVLRRAQEDSSGKAQSSNSQAQFPAHPGQITTSIPPMWKISLAQSRSLFALTFNRLSKIMQKVQCLLSSYPINKMPFHFAVIPNLLAEPKRREGRIWNLKRQTETLSQVQGDKTISNIVSLGKRGTTKGRGGGSKGNCVMLTNLPACRLPEPVKGRQALCSNSEAQKYAPTWIRFMANTVTAVRQAGLFLPLSNVKTGYL